MMDTETEQWSGLRRDLMEEILKRLESRADIDNLRAVCSSWRSLVPPPPNNSVSGLSLRLPYPIFRSNSLPTPKRLGHFILKESTVYRIEPPLGSISNGKNWFVRVEECESGKVRLGHPISTYPLDCSSKILPKVLDLLELRVSEVAKSYAIQFVQTRKKKVNLGELKSMEEAKVVVSSQSRQGDIAIAVMVLHDGRLGLWRTGEKKWTCLDINRGVQLQYSDIAFHKGEFYAVDCRGLALAFDPFSLVVHLVGNPINYGGVDKFLVKSLDERDMFMIEKSVVWGPDFSVGFEVYRLNEENDEWVSAIDLPERAFFLGDHCCFFVSVGESSGSMGNSIYFTDACFGDRGKNYIDWDVGLFNILEDSVRPLVMDPRHSNIFWPPPDWLLQGTEDYD